MVPLVEAEAELCRVTRQVETALSHPPQPLLPLVALLSCQRPARYQPPRHQLARHPLHPLLPPLSRPPRLVKERPRFE